MGSAPYWPRQAEKQINTLVGFVRSEHIGAQHKFLKAFGLVGACLVPHLAMIGLLYSSLPSQRKMDHLDELKAAELVSKAMVQVRIVKSLLDTNVGSPFVEKFLASARLEEEQLRAYSIGLMQNSIRRFEDPMSALRKDMRAGGPLDMDKYIEGPSIDGNMLLATAASSDAKSMNLAYKKLEAHKYDFDRLVSALRKGFDDNNFGDDDPTITTAEDTVEHMNIDVKMKIATFIAAQALFKELGPRPKMTRAQLVAAAIDTIEGTLCVTIAPKLALSLKQVGDADGPSAPIT